MGNFKLRDQIKKNRLKKLAEQSGSYSRGAYFDRYRNRYIRINNSFKRKKFYKQYVTKAVRHEMKCNLKKNYENDYLTYSGSTIRKYSKSKTWYNY